MPKQLLNIFKTTFKKSKKRLFGAQNGQITGTNFSNFGKSVDFWLYFGPKSSNIASKVLKPDFKIVSPLCETPYKTKNLKKTS